MQRKWTPPASVMEKSSCAWDEEELDLQGLKIYRGEDHTTGYQRQLSQEFVNHIIESKLDLSECRTIFVSRRRDGSEWVLDGQHTREILLATGVTTWVCRVFEGLSPKEEAQRFVEYQENSRRLAPIAKWQAQWAGGDEKVVAIERILADQGLRISNSRMRTVEGFLPISSRVVMENIYELGGENLLTAVLEISKEAWGLNKRAFYGMTLLGLANFLAYVDRPVEKKRLIAVLSEETPRTIAEQAGSIGSYGTAGWRVAAAVQERYRLGDGTGAFEVMHARGVNTPKLPKVTKGGRKPTKPDRPLFT